ncbi:MAG: hypothetical protein QXK69_04020 [Candidatus Caldarchaeum sp.]|jgi:cell division GTPase FtsZ|uniref:Tubulin/FtsZ GTPase domain-containing protein n=1 Tax=Caldiarchaeum subterraneum TaxID=311458 RepID=A0A7J3G4R8_CALS0
MMSRPVIAVPVLYGVGSGGSRIAATAVTGVGPGGRRSLQRLENIEPVCISSSKADIEALSKHVDRHLFLIGDGTGSGMDPEKGRRDYLEHTARREIIEMPRKIAEEKGMERIDLIPVIFTAGYGCGSGAGPELLSDLAKNYPNSAVIGICTLPFSWEGPETSKRAFKALERACKHAPTIPASNSYLIGDSLDIDFIKALNLVNERILKPLTATLRAFTSARAITVIDSSDLRRVLKPGPVLAMHWSLPSPSEIANLSAYNSSTLAPVQKGFGKVSSLAIIEAGGRGLTPAAAEALPEQLSNILQARISEIKTLLTTRPESEKTYVTLLIGGVKLYA